MKPAITELNAFNTAGSTANLPVLIRSRSQDSINRYAAWVAHAYVKTLLTHSPVEEVSFWSIGGGGETSTVIGTDHPIRTAAMLAIKAAAAPGLRALKRGSRTEGRFSLPLHVQSTGTQSYTSNRVAQTATGYVRIPWTWFNAAWMERPISKSDYIVAPQFYVTSAPASGSPIAGVYNSGQTNSSVLQLNGTTLQLVITVGGSVVLTQNLGTITLNAHQRVAVRMNVTLVKVSLNGGAVQSFEAWDSFSDPEYVYWLSKPAGTFASIVSSTFLDVHHGPDWNTDADLRALGTAISRSISLGVYDGS